MMRMENDRMKQMLEKHGLKLTAQKTDELNLWIKEKVFSMNC